MHPTVALKSPCSLQVYIFSKHYSFLPFCCNIFFVYRGVMPMSKRIKRSSHLGREGNCRRATLSAARLSCFRLKGRIDYVFANPFNYTMGIGALDGCGRASWKTVASGRRCMCPRFHHEALPFPCIMSHFPAVKTMLEGQHVLVHCRSNCVLFHACKV